MHILFTKAHGAKNDFLLTWQKDAPPDRLVEASIAICDRHTGVGADGWLIVAPGPAGESVDGTIQLFNPDGSVAEISGNGTRCAAAFLLDADVARGPEVRILTGAGLKFVRLISRDGVRFLFEMNMGAPVCRDGPPAGTLPIPKAVETTTLVEVGNPQCAFLVDHFHFDWRACGRQVETHPFFPNRTNVSFFRPLDRHVIEVLFWERGAGETMSSGTGSTGAAAAAIYRGVAEPPITVRTPAGDLAVRLEGSVVYLTGPAEITASGVFNFL